MAGFASKKQVLIVGNDGVQLFAVTGKSVSLYADIPATNPDIQDEMRQALVDVGTPVLVLFDVVEQQYRKEILPEVGFMDRGKVIQRKLQMAFPQQKMRTFLLMKQKQNEAGGLTALFASLSESPLNNAVIEAVLAAGVAVIGAGLLPLESTSLITKLVQEAHNRAQTPDDTRWSVLMTYHRTGGLRQIVIKDGELALTRMTPIPPVNDAGQIAGEMAREFNATLTYLSRFGYVPADGLDLVVVSSPDICHMLRQQSLPVKHLYPLTLQEVGQFLGVSMVANDLDDTFADIIHAAWVGTQKKLAVPLESPMLGKVRMARQMARYATIALILASIYFAYQNIMLMGGSYTEISGLSEQRARNASLKQEVDALSKSLNTLKYDPDKSRIMLGIYNDFAKKDLHPDPLFATITGVMNRDVMRLQEIAVVEETMENNITRYQQMAASAMGNPDDAVNVPQLPVVAVKLVIAFSDHLTIEEAAQETYKYVENLRKVLPGRDVMIDDIVGNLSESKTVQGHSEQVEGNRVEGRQVKAENVSKLTIRGMLQ